MEIRFIRLLTGEDLVAELTQEGKKITMKRPMKVGYISNGSTVKQGIFLFPWIFPSTTKNDEFEIATSNIITMAEPATKLEKLYTKCIDYYYENEVDAKLVEEDEDFIEESPEANTASNLFQSFLNKRKDLN